MGDELLGDLAYDVYKLTERDFSQEEQTVADSNMLEFIGANQDLVTIAEINLMPLTTLT